MGDAVPPPPLLLFSKKKQKVIFLRILVESANITIVILEVLVSQQALITL